MTSFLAGLIAGAVHVFMGPDHLAAVAPLAIVERKRSWILGVRWGLGHASGVVFVAILAWLFREVLPVEIFSSHCERLVGVMLVAIGIWGVRKALRLELHVHAHQHDEGYAHLHLHAHAPVTQALPKVIRTGVQQGPCSFGSSTERHPYIHNTHTHAAMIVGIFHGLAGGSHIMGVLPALAMPTREAAALYLFAFGLGTVGAMAGFSILLGNLGKRFEDFGILHLKRVMVTFSSAAIVLGAYWMI